MQKRRVVFLGRMLAGLVLALSLTLASGVTVWAQQPGDQPLTFWYQYTVRPGKEADFMNLVNAVGAPVRDKLMAEGVVLAWGVETPLLRSPEGGGTHLIWYSVADWSGIEKGQRGLQAQLAKMAADEAKAAEEARKKNQKPGMTTAERIQDAVDMSKTRDYLTRDILFGVSTVVPPAGTLPFTRYNFAKAHPGMGAAFRATWEKYNKPVWDKLVADGVVLAYGLAVEELKTDSNFTHFVWYGVKSMADFNKIGAAFAADRSRRSPEERDAINAAFAGATDPDAARNYVTFTTVFKVAGQK